MELFDPFDKNWLKNKFKFYEEMRNLETAYWSEKYKMFVFTRYDDVMHILSKPKIFISGQGNLIRDNPGRYGLTPGASDGAVHTDYRNIIKDAYSKTRIDAINLVIREKTIEYLKDVKQGEVIDIAHVIRLVSYYMSAEILNLPEDRDLIANLILNIQLKSSKTILHNFSDSEHFRLSGLIKKILLDKTPPPGPGIHQEFLENSKKDSPLSLFLGPVVSGCYSMISALEFLVLNLHNHQVIKHLIQDTTLINAAVEESLRINSTTGKFARTVTESVTLRGINLKPGDKVAVCLDAANRDPAMFENPNKFDLARYNGKSNPFGYGTHACAGQAIAKAGVIEFLSAFLEAIGNYEILTTEEQLDYIITASANNDVVDKIIIKKL